MVAIAMFLDRKGHSLGPAAQDLEDFAVHVAESRPSLDEIEEWISTLSRRHQK